MRVAVAACVALSLLAPDPSAALGGTVTATDRGLLGTTPLIPALSRDCGISVRLSDGHHLWLFCDSYYTSNTGVLHASLYNGAAFAKATAPTDMYDHIYSYVGEYLLNSSAARPQGHNFITLPTDPVSFVCDGVRKAWPRGAVAVPAAGVGGADRVYVYYSRICDRTLIVGRMSFETRGVGLAYFDYLPRSFNPTVGVTAPIQATRLLNDYVFGTATPFGSAALLSSDGQYVISYRCAAATCYATRAPVGTPGQVSSYRSWNGTDWGGVAVPMSMPGVGAPYAQFTVQYVPRVGKYVMTYSPCGTGCLYPFVDRLHMRTSANPQGPWSEPLTVMLPNCDTTTPCNAAAGHREVGGAEVGFTYSRRGEGSHPPGRLHWGTVPLSSVTALR